MPLTVRRASADDAAALAALATEAYRATYTGVVDDATVDAVIAQTCTPAAFERLAGREKPDRLLVAEDGLELKGFLDFADEPDGLELRRLYARPGQTGRGVGRVLLAALEEALPLGTRYRIVVAEKNTRGLAFWQRQGFRLRGEVDGVAHFAAHRGVAFDAGAGSTRLLVLDRTVGAPTS